MARRTQGIRCWSYDAAGFSRFIASWCGGEHAAQQIGYLTAYFDRSKFGVKTVVVEPDYVDRHYIEEFSRYYATSVGPPDTAKTTRLHFFSEEFTDTELKGWVAACVGSPHARSRLNEKLQQAYFGYVVVRPLPDAPVGRTVLSPYRGDTRRVIASIRPHAVHLLGLELFVHGVPFQQQESAVGACSTTAAWSALAAVSRASGRRAPTPYEVTEAATRSQLGDREIPAENGLELGQLLLAVRDVGFSPSVLRAQGGQFGLFSHALKCYLRSGIPVILILHDDDGHAVTAVGYRQPCDKNPTGDLIYTSNQKVRIVTPGMARLYVHEDRLGPYARMDWESGPLADCPASVCGDTFIRHRPFDQISYRYATNPMQIWYGIAPVHPKIRLSPAHLLEAAARVMPTIRRAVHAAQGEDVKVELKYSLSGDYLKEVLSFAGASQAKIVDFLATAALSRYVGVIRYFWRDEPVADAVVDTTDIWRERPRFAGLVDVIALDSHLEPLLEQFVERHLA